MEIELFDEISTREGIMSENFYDKHYYKDLNPQDPIERRARVKSPEQKFLESVFTPKPGERVLDVGCGPGVTLGMLEETGADLWGIDLSKIAIEIARKRVSKPDQVICADAVPLPFKAGEFDYILAWGVIEHFPSIPVILAEIVRCVKKGGGVIIMVPNAYYYKFVWDTLRKGSGPRKLQEVETLYSFKEWKDLIEAAGLTVVRFARHNKFNKPVWAWLRDRLIPFYFSNHFVFVCKK